MNGEARQSEMSVAGFFALFFGVKKRLLINHLSNFRKHMWIHLGLAIIALTMLIGGGDAMFKMIFRMFSGFELFGDYLAVRLIKMVLLAFFSMLTFSNLIIMLTTTYLSREVESLMSQPIGHRPLFFGKLGESILYSSWAFLVLSCPLFLSIGQSRHLGIVYYLGLPVLIAPFLILPAAIGALVALVITVYFPPRQIIRFGLAMAGLGILSALYAQHVYGLDKILGFSKGGNSREDLGHLMRLLGFGDLLMLPSAWLGDGLIALQYRNWGETLLWGTALWTTAAMAIVVLDWLAGPLYFRGYCSVRSSGTTQRTRQWGFYGIFDKALFWLPRPTRALVTKDLCVFWRDPAQWSQLLILFGLLFIYIANLRSAAEMTRMEAVLPGWRTVLAMFNIGATTFVLSILTTRFVFPMLSLEGKQQWVIGLAPVGRTRLVWVKFFVSCASAIMLTLPLAMLSSFMLNTARPIIALSATMVVFMATGLSGMAVGFGALMPSFNDDNPARISSGLGGTVNAVLSLIYIGLSLAMVSPWVQAYLEHGIPQIRFLRAIFFCSIPAWILLQVAAITIPMRMGLRKWARIEF
jgi:ABC-2 type transport system permease protein